MIRNRLWVHSDDANDPYCITYLINRGWRVEGRTFTVEFTATGIASGFECALDRMEHIDCKIFHTSITGSVFLRTMTQVYISSTISNATSLYTESVVSHYNSNITVV